MSLCVLTKNEHMQVDWCRCCCKKNSFICNFQTQYSQWTLSIGQRYHTFAKCTCSVCHSHRIKGWLNYNLNARFDMHLKLSPMKCKEKILLSAYTLDQICKKGFTKNMKKIWNQHNKNRATKILILFLVGMFFFFFFFFFDGRRWCQNEKVHSITVHNVIVISFI